MRLCTLVMVFVSICAAYSVTSAEAPDPSLQDTLEEALVDWLGAPDSDRGWSEELFAVIRREADLPSDFSFRPMIRGGSDEERSGFWFSGDGYSVDLHSMKPATRDANDILVQLSSWRQRAYRLFVVGRREGELRRLPTTKELPFDEVVQQPRLVRLENQTQGIAIYGWSGMGRMGHFTLVRRTPEDRYEVLWSFATSGWRVAINDSEEPATFSYTEQGGWDPNLYPVHELGHVSMATVTPSLRRFTVESRWSAGDNTVVEIDRSEVIHPFAAMNHLLRALKDDDPRAARAFWDGDGDLVEVAETLEIERLLEADTVRLVERWEPWWGNIPTPNELDEAGTEILPLAVVDNGDGWGVDLKEVEDLYIFFVTKSDPAQVVGIARPHIQDIPEALDLDRADHPRPTRDFDRLSIYRYALRHGWDEANRRAKQIVQQRNVGDWLHVGAILRTPLVNWIEAHYAADLRFEGPRWAEEFYERMKAEGSLFMLEMRSGNADSLSLDNVRFIASDGGRMRWEGNATAGDIEEIQFLGTSMKSRVIWIDIPELDLNTLESLDSLTLHVVHRTRLQRADLTWDFRD